MKKYLDIFYFLFFSIVSIIVYDESKQKYQIQLNGEIIDAILVNIKPGRLCTATILYDNRYYSVELAKSDCYDNEISTGKKIKLKYLKNADEFIIPESNVTMIYYLSILFFIVPIAFMLKIIRKLYIVYKKE